MPTNKKVYLLLQIFNLILGAYLQQPNPALMQLHETAKVACAQESGYTLDAANKVSFETVSKADDKFKCYEKCMFLKLGVMDNSGNILPDGLQKLVVARLNATVNDEVLAKCKNAGGTDRSNLCEVAFDLMKCVTPALVGHKITNN